MRSSVKNLEGKYWKFIMENFLWKVSVMSSVVKSGVNSLCLETKEKI